MKSNTVSTRQLCFILAFFLPVNKIILLPSVLARYAENDLLISALITLLLQGGAIFALLWLMQKKQATLYELIQGRFGEWTARICYFVLALYFIFSAILPLAEHKLYIEYVMYDTLPSLIIFLPFFFFSAYAASKGLQSSGRAADISMPLFLISLPVLLFMATASADFTSLLPVGSTAIPQILKGAAGILSWCSDAAWLLLLMGNVKIEKHFLTKTSLSYAFGSLVVLLFLAIFYAIFSTVALNEAFAVAKIARYYNALKTLGRIDYLFIYILSLVQLFALVVPVQLSVQALAKTFRSDKLYLFSLIVNAALLVVIILTTESFPALERIFNEYLFPVFLLFANIIPLLCPLFALKKKKGEGSEKR
ncbi:MAG: GerAB/ArcD/ProY family transporter [Clostridia bacterium]|nr:GerAB/ArcD/ProY family transporter [Clostridia bacterium]